MSTKEIVDTCLLKVATPEKALLLATAVDFTTYTKDNRQETLLMISTGGWDHKWGGGTL